MTGHFQSPFSSNEILVIDQAPLLEEARNDFEKAFQSIERIKFELRHFDDNDLPAYNSWVHATFGKHLTRSRELSLKLQECEKALAVLRERHWARFFSDGPCMHFESGLGRDENVSAGVSGPHARWQSFVDGEDELGPGRQERRYQEAGGAFDDEEDAHYHEDEESVRRFEELFSKRTARSGSVGGGQARTREEYVRDREARRWGPAACESGEAQKLTERELRSNRLKDLYRALARRLHPDVNPDLTCEEKSLWNQVQSAYEKESLEQLDLLLALSNVFSGRISRSSSLYEIRRARQEIEKVVGPLRKKLEAARKHRAWGFSGLVDRVPLHRLVEREMQADLAQLRQRLCIVETQIERFSRNAGETE